MFAPHERYGSLTVSPHLCRSPVWIFLSESYMHDETLLQIQLPAVNAFIPALCGSTVYLSDVVHQACFVTSNKETTLLTAPPATQRLLLVDSLPPLLQLILLIALLCDHHIHTDAHTTHKHTHTLLNRN